MAAPTSPKPIYHDPSFGQTRNHSRRGSMRKSFTSWTGLQLESPRTLCPLDEDAFSFDAAHLAEWYTPEDLWDFLPESLQKTIIVVQHGGAAVLTGFDRLERHMEKMEGQRITHKMDEDELLVKLDTLPSPELRLIRQASSGGLSVFTNSSSLGSPALSSQSNSTSPVSPICLSPVDIVDKPERYPERAFNAPLEAHDAYYRTELSHLRTEALPRLRHASIKVDAEVYETKLFRELSSEELKEFEAWWNEVKLKIGHLNEKAKRLSGAIGLSSTGLGWTAP